MHESSPKIDRTDSIDVWSTPPIVGHQLTLKNCYMRNAKCKCESKIKLQHVLFLQYTAIRKTVIEPEEIWDITAATQHLTPAVVKINKFLK